MTIFQTDTNYYIELYDFYIEKLGLTYYKTTWNENIAYSGLSYKTSNIKRGNITNNIELKIDKLKLTMARDDFEITFNSTSYDIIEALKYGWLENMRVIVYAYDLSLAVRQKMFTGYLKADKTKYDYKTITFEFTSILDFLKVNIPIYYFQTQCNNIFGDHKCGLDLDNDQDIDGDDLKLTGQTITAVANNKELTTGTTTLTSKFNLGLLEFTSGKLSGLTYKISHITTGGDILLSEPLPFTSVVGAGVNIYQGCDKAGSTCDERFDNYANFFGFEYIPNKTLKIRK